jgi:hypothetical protein
MPSLPNSVAGQDPVTVTGSWQRHLPPRYFPQAMQGRASYSRWGRARGFPVLYLGRPLDSVVVEAYRHLVDPVDDPTIVDHLAPRGLVTARVSVTEILDLRTASTRVACGLTLAQLQSGTEDSAAYRACQEIAAAAHQQGFHGLVAPAATQLGETLALFSDRLPANEAPVITAEELWDRLPRDPRAEGRHLRAVPHPG